MKRRFAAHWVSANRQLDLLAKSGITLLLFVGLAMRYLLP